MVGAAAKNLSFVICLSEVPSASFALSAQQQTVHTLVVKCRCASLQQNDTALPRAHAIRSCLNQHLYKYYRAPVAGQALTNWTAFPLPLDNVQDLGTGHDLDADPGSNGPVFYRQARIAPTFSLAQ